MNISNQQIDEKFSIVIDRHRMKPCLLDDVGVISLGDLSIEGGFSDAQDQAMLQAYCSGDPKEHEYSRVLVYPTRCVICYGRSGA